MPFSKKRDISFALLVTLALLPAFGCRNRQEARSLEAEAAVQSEPESYSATIVRTIDGSEIQSIQTRIARQGEMRREEWNEQGHRLAIITRPDLGRLFLLDLDKQTYVERALSPAASEAGPGSSNANRSQSIARDDKSHDDKSRDDESGPEPPVDAGQIERAFDDAASPQSVVRRAIAGQTIENHPCEGFEQQATFLDGRVEITRVFRALDLAGLAIRIESESEGNVKIITERRDVKIEVSPDEFIVPASFKKVERLGH